MKSPRINLIAAMITIVIAIIGFLIIYQDIAAVPKYNKTFVYCTGGKNKCNLI